jgi:hypothetical protein
MQLIQIKQNRIPTHTYMVQVVLLHDKLNVDWHDKDKASVSYTKLNEVEIPYLVFSIYSICY